MYIHQELIHDTKQIHSNQVTQTQSP